MIVAMQDMADETQIQQVIEHLVKIGFEVHRSTGARQTVLGAVGAGIDFDIRNLELLPGVQEVNRGPLPGQDLVRIFERIMDVMRNIQKEEIVAKAEGTKAEAELDSKVND